MVFEKIRIYCIFEYVQNPLQYILYNIEKIIQLYKMYTYTFILFFNQYFTIQIVNHNHILCLFLKTSFKRNKIRLNTNYKSC